MPEGLEVNTCSVKYPGVETRALSKLSFKLPRGSFLVISGASGSGKTTLLRSIAGLVDLSDGKITWGGSIIQGPADRLVPGYNHIKLITQELELQEKMTVRENLRHALRAFSDPYKSERVEELIKICRLKDLEERRPDQLSGGQRQRVVWAVNLSDEPELLLLDEPFSHLDVMLKSEMTTVLKQIHRELRITVIMVTHDPSEALSLADKILLLRLGKMDMLATPKTMYNQPATAYGAAFFGEANIFTRKNLESIGVKTSEANGKWMVRPEDVALEAEGRGVEATVTDVQFRGFYYMIHLRTSQHVEIKAILNRALKTGSKWLVKWPVSKLHHLKK
ncbi:ABC transporter ATP-binding protein [uncultured Imperialibacter sp.]|uniref:ABC transporter ATP-binding protein n=1 Tax=uncultured Imperialibacter sp. TaxID=1672639 RepID=UPI0030D95921|tara:strand:- start:2159 stop:3163 length:1005 start_codon:yes stop_codon:yes gene_type:complete